MKREKAARFAVTCVIVVGVLVISAYHPVHAQSPDWPKTCVIGPQKETVTIGGKTDGYPTECLMAPDELTDCLRVTKPFAGDPKLLAEAEKRWKQHCREAVLARWPDADETYEQIQAKAKAQENRDFAVGAAFLLVGGIVIVVAIVAAIWFALAFAAVIIPLALLVIALHFLGCF